MLQALIRLFLESHPQKVGDLGSDFGRRSSGLQNTMRRRVLKKGHFLSSDFGPPSDLQTHHRLTAILVPDSNTMEDRTRVCGMTVFKGKWERDALRRQASEVVSGVAPSKSCSFGLDFGFWSRLDCKTPWLDSHTGPRFQYHGGQNTLCGIGTIKGKWERDALRPDMRLFLRTGVAPSKSW